MYYSTFFHCEENNKHFFFDHIIYIAVYLWGYIYKSIYEAEKAYSMYYKYFGVVLIFFFCSCMNNMRKNKINL